MVDWLDEDDDLHWDTDEESPPSPPDGNSRRDSCTVSVGGDYSSTAAAAEVSVPGSSRSPIVADFMAMGFGEEIVLKAIEENGDENMEAILETLLMYKAIVSAPSLSDQPVENLSDGEGEDDNQANVDEDNEEFGEDHSEGYKNFLLLVDMGFSCEDASAAIKRCGPDAALLELADSIHAAQVADTVLGSDDYYKSNASVTVIGKKRRCAVDVKRRKGSPTTDLENMVVFPNPMVGFGLPDQRMQCIERKLPDTVIGPPFFYYENVALAPKGVWDTISRFLYDIQPEFVDSKFFSAAARKRGYIHNLPIHNRFPLYPILPKTIQEGFPNTVKWWPSWDSRTQLNCLQTAHASSKLTERIRRQLEKYDGLPPPAVRQYVINECKKWNLIWVGTHKVAPLEPDEIEKLLGFPENHTRGISRTDRYKSLGNSFQIDTVAYHLSALKDLFPHGMVVLSLFSGIGGAEVALHRLGIYLRAVVSVEILEHNRDLVKSWWEQTEQTGELIHVADVQQLDANLLRTYIRKFGGFDMVIGGSPCNNLAGSNRYTRDGLDGTQSALFYEYVRILDLVKCIMNGTL